MATIGRRIRERRTALGLSVDELAARLGKNRATVYRYESDEIENFPTSIIVPLANALQTTPGYLMGWESSPGDLCDSDRGTEKTPTPVAEDGREVEVKRLFDALSEEGKASALNYLRYLAANADNQ